MSACHFQHPLWCHSGKDYQNWPQVNSLLLSVPSYPFCSQLAGQPPVFFSFIHLFCLRYTQIHWYFHQWEAIRNNSLCKLDQPCMIIFAWLVLADVLSEHFQHYFPYWWKSWSKTQKWVTSIYFMFSHSPYLCPHLWCFSQLNHVFWYR